MRILVIGGGISDERDISLRSAKSVFDAIGEEYSKEFYDWDGSAEWLESNKDNFDVVLPILHGVGGEDGQIQSLLERLELHYLGSDSEVSKLCMDKVLTQAKLKASGVLVPEQARVTKDEYYRHDLTNGSHVLKPIYGGSSLDTFVLREGRLDEARADDVFGRYDALILERCILGREITIPVLDGYDLPVIEIIPPEGVFFDYENKYNGKSQEICHPDSIPEVIQRQAKELSRQCHDILGCRHLSRVDIILTDQNDMYVLEVNTIPGLTDQSLFPKAAAYAGLSMSQLVEYFIRLASSGEQ